VNAACVTLFALLCGSTAAAQRAPPLEFLPGADVPLLRARRAAAALCDALPPVTCRQTTTRRFLADHEEKAKTLDVVQSEVTWRGGIEEVDDYRVKGKPAGPETRARSGLSPKWYLWETKYSDCRLAGPPKPPTP
jgi:hypothetical protein